MNIAKHWKTIVDTLQDGLLVIGPGGDILAANPAAEQLTGYTADELVGESCQILNCTECKIIGEGTGNKWCSLFADETVRDKQCLITNKDQRSVHVIKSATVLRDQDGTIIGAVETLTDISEYIRQQQEIVSLRKTLHWDEGFHGILGTSTTMQKLFELIDNVAQTDAPVIITGQSGTGKEMVARAIHEESTRRNGPFVKVNCAALNQNLLESELFGHIKGAYTGADQSRVGRFEAAHKGSIFLDEIGDIPLSTQVKLLRVLEEKEIERVGDHKPISVDVRIITATNKNLENLIQQNLFREDLFFRINVFPLYCPSLAERIEDIPIIVQNFIQQNTLKGNKNIEGISPEAMEILMSYSWPGNVRELRNAIEYAFVLCPGGDIKKEHLPPKIIKGRVNSDPTGDAISYDDSKRKALLHILRQTKGNQSETARIMGVSRVTIWKRIKKYGIDLTKDLAIKS
jgi:PAS domain S-box-containing protein